MSMTFKTLVESFHIPAVFPAVEDESLAPKTNVMADLKARLLQAYESRATSSKLAW